jgi:hypothetical protein
MRTYFYKSMNKYSFQEKKYAYILLLKKYEYVLHTYEKSMCILLKK